MRMRLGDIGDHRFAGNLSSAMSATLPFGLRLARALSQRQSNTNYPLGILSVSPALRRSLVLLLTDLMVAMGTL